MKNIIRSVFILLLVVAANRSFGQSQAFPISDADSLVGILLGNNSNITISGAVLDCDGDSTASGSFEATSSNLGMAAGIVLTSGAIQDAVGVNDATGETQYLTGGGDPDLNALITQTTTDVCILEFDMFIPGDTVKFNYVFGSEEYNDFVNTSYNDVFGFFISGPNPAGGSYTNLNIAQLPTSSSGNFNINLNNVNCGTNGQYYVCNDWGTPTGGGCTTQCPTTSAGTTVGYDGFTTVLTAWAHVIPCNEYHLKIAVADVSDQALDSGVFLEAGSLTSNAVDIELGSLYTDPNGNAAAVEGCDFNTEFEIHLDVYTLIGDSVINVGSTDTACFAVILSGSAIEGVDYDELPDTICFYPGDTLLSLTINAIADGITEGVDTITITLVPTDTLLNACGATGASANVLIYDELVINATPDTAICIGQSVMLNVNAAPNVTWSGSSTPSCTNCLNPVVTPTFGGPNVYSVSAGIAPCIATDQVTVTVNDPSPVQVPDTIEICIGQSADITASNANTYSWSPSTNLSGTTGATVTANPTVTTTYTVTGVNACTTTQADVVLVVHPLPNITTTGDVSICPENDAPISASSGPGSTYSWNPSSSLSASNISNPVADPDNTTTYYVTVTTIYGCVDVDSVVVSVYDPEELSPQASPDVIYINETSQLSTAAGSNFLWTPDLWLSDIHSGNPVATPLETTTYTVTATDVNGCSMEGTVTVTVLKDAFLQVPNAFSPNGDGMNDQFRILWKGIFRLDKFAVYDRWGKEVFATSDVSKGWDGKINGEPADVGTYAYVILGYDLDNASIEQYGNVTVVR